MDYKELSEIEMIEISGGESGWYYIGYAAGAVDKALGKFFFYNPTLWRTSVK